MAPTRRIFIFDSPRTRSQLFNQIFASHSQIHQIFHPFYVAGGLGPERLTARFQQCQEAEEVQLAMAQTPGASDMTFVRAFEDLATETQLAESNGGKIAWIKEHTFNCLQPEVVVEMAKHSGSTAEPQTNVTNMPDDFLDTLTPVFLIRHPALMIPSWYRAQKQTLREGVADESFRVFSSLQWSRRIFDLFLSRHGAAPLVLDGERLVANPEVLVAELCDRLGLDKKGVRFEWEPVPEEEQERMDFMRRFFFRDLMVSRRIMSSRAKLDVDVDQEQTRWVDEFGNEIATDLRKLVDENMAHYNYLLDFALAV